MNNVDEAIKYLQKGAANLPDQKSPMYDYMLRQYQIGMAANYLTLQKPDSAMHYVQALLLLLIIYSLHLVNLIQHQ